MRSISKSPLANSKLLTFALFAAMAGCSTSELDEQSIEKDGQAVKGVISQGLVSAYFASNGQLITQTRTDNAGNFLLELEDVPEDSLVLVSLTVDSDTRMRCDLVEGCKEKISGQTLAFGEEVRLPSYFHLHGVTTGSDSESVFLSPLSHIIVNTAQSLPQGLTGDNIENSTQWVMDSFGLSDDPLITQTVDLTALDDSSDESLKQGILSAALYEHVIEADWSSNTQLLDTLPMAEVLFDASDLAIQLSSHLDSQPDSQNTYASALSEIANNTQELAQDTEAPELKIQSHPQRLTALESESFSLHVRAYGGTEALQYQWQKNGVVIAGAITNTLHIPSAQLSDSGLYSVTVSSGNESIQSLGALVTIEENALPVSIVQQPTPSTVNEGDSIHLTVVASGSGPISYQWQKDASVIPGATESSLTIDSSTLSDAGRYGVVVSNDSSQVYSSFVEVTVNEQSATPPPNDDSPSLLIERQPQSLTVETSQSFTLSVSASGGNSGYLYQWQKDGNNILGATADTYFRQDTLPEDAGLYSVLVTSGNDSILSESARITVTEQPVSASIVEQPKAVTVTEGETISLSVTAAGSGNIVYQWQKGAAFLTGETNRTLVIPSSELNDAGQYRVLVHNGFSRRYSDFVSVEVIEKFGSQTPPSVPSEPEPEPEPTEPTTPPVEPEPEPEPEPTPALQIHSQPQSISTYVNESIELRVSASGGSGSISYQWQKDGTNINGATSSTYFIQNSQLSDTGLYNVLISSGSEAISSLDALVVIEENIQPVVIDQQPVATTLNEGEAILLNVVVSGDGPISYQWQKGGSVLPGQTSSTLSIASSTKDDSGSYRVAVSNEVSTVYSDFVEVRVNEQMAAPIIESHPSSLTVNEESSASFNVTASGDGFLAYQWRKNGSPIDGAYSNTLTIDPVSMSDAGNYDITVSNSQGSVTSEVAALNVLPLTVPVSITQQPSAQDLFAGQEISLTVRTTGDGPMSYQWMRHSEEIPGATAQDLSIPNATVSDSGLYSVVVRNEHSEAVSNFAFVEVQPIPPVSLSWATPTSRENGSYMPREDIDAYIIEYGYSASELDQSLRVSSDINNYTLSDMPSGTLYLRIATIDNEEVQGNFSEIISVTIP